MEVVALNYCIEDATTAYRMVDQRHAGKPGIIDEKPISWRGVGAMGRKHVLSTYATGSGTMLISSRFGQLKQRGVILPNSYYQQKTALEIELYHLSSEPIEYVCVFS